MLASRIQRVVLSAMIAALAPLGSGCYVDLPPPVAVDGYAPDYYDGYLVYYDIEGRPYYYADGAVYYVPRTHVHYDVLVHRYHTHRRPYHRWYVNGGYRYKNYRHIERPYHRR